MMIALEAEARITSDSVDSSHTSVDHLDHHFIVRKLEKALLQGLRSARLYYDIQFFQVAFLDLIEQIVKRHS